MRYGIVGFRVAERQINTHNKVEKCRIVLENVKISTNNSKKMLLCSTKNEENFKKLLKKSAISDIM